MNLQIEKVENGYVASWWEYGEENINHQHVFQERDEEGGEVKCFQELLYFVTEYFAMIGSKHDKYRIRIGTENEPC